MPSSWRSRSRSSPPTSASRAAASSTRSSAAPRRRSRRSRRAPAARSSRCATSSAGSATPSTPRARTRSSSGEVERLRSALAESQTAQRDAAQLSGLVGLQQEDGFPHGTEPVAARVIARSPTVWYSSVKIDKGSSDGVKVDQPVIAAGTTRRRRARGQGHERHRRHRRGHADHRRVERRLGPGDARRRHRRRPPAGRQPARPAPRLRRGRPRDRGHDGRHLRLPRSSKGESLFPRGIPIGRVTEVDLDELELYQRVHIEPFADLRRIDFVQVLTRAPARRPDRRGDRAVILSPGAFLRVGVLLLLAVVLQLSGAQPDRHPRRPRRPRGARRGGRRVLRAAASPAAPSGFAAGFLLDLAERGHDGRLLARAHGGRLRRRALPRAARPEPRAAADGGRRGGHGRLGPRVRRRVVHARRGRQREPAGDPRHDRDRPAERAARPAGLRGRPQRAAPGRWPSTRSSAAAAASRRARPARSASAASRSGRCTSTTTAARRSRRSSRCAWPSSAASRWWCSRSSSSGSGTSRCSRATSTWPRRSDNRVREIKVQAPRGEIVDRDGRVLVDNRTGAGGQGHARTSSRRTRAERREALPAARQAARHERRARIERGSSASSRRCRSRRRRSSRTWPRARGYLLEHQDELPRRRAGSGSSCASTRTTSRRPPVRHGRRGHRGAAEGPALPRRRAGRPRRPVRASSTSTTASCAARTAPAACRSTRSATSSGALQARGSRSRAASCACRWTSTCRRRRQRRSPGGTGQGAFVVMDVTQRRGARARHLSRRSTRTSSRRRSSSPASRASSERATARRCSTARSRREQDQPEPSTRQGNSTYCPRPRPRLLRATRVTACARWPTTTSPPGFSEFPMKRHFRRPRGCERPPG